MQFTCRPQRQASDPWDTSHIPLDAPLLTRQIIRQRRAINICCAVPLHSAMGSSLCAIYIPPTRVCAFLSNRRSHRILFGPPQPNALRATVDGWSPTGLPRAVASRIVEEIYQCTVCPRTYELNQSQAFSDSVRLRRAHTLTHLSSLALPRASRYAPARLQKRRRKRRDAGSDAEWLLRTWHRVNGEVRR